MRRPWPPRDLPHSPPTLAALRLRPIIARGMPQAPLSTSMCPISTVPPAHFPQSRMPACAINTKICQAKQSVLLITYFYLPSFPDSDHERSVRPRPHIYGRLRVLVFQSQITYLVRQAPVSLEPETHPGSCLHAVWSLPEPWREHQTTVRRKPELA